jgi:hypothetical protein
MTTANSSRSATIKGKGNYGIKISKDTKNIYDADRYMIMQSKYPVLKLKSSGSGTGVQTAGNGGFTVEITHGLGYVPICFVTGEYFDTPSHTVIAKYSNGIDGYIRAYRLLIYYYYYADTTKLYIVFNACYLTDDYSFDLHYMYHFL